MNPARRRRPALVAGFLAAAVGLLGGCSIPTDENAAPLASDQLPAALQPDATTPVPSTLPPQIPSAEAVIYLQRQTDDVDTIGDLVAVTRPVTENSLRNALRALVTSGVTPAETEEGLITQFEPADGQPIQISIVGRPDPRTVVLDLSDDNLRGCAEPHIVGDATNDDVLKQAGVERAHSLVAALASDADNLVLAVSARRLNPRLRIVSRANAADSAQKLRTIDLDTVVEPYEMAGNRLATAALRPHTSDYLDQVFSIDSDKVELTEVEVHEGCHLVGLSTSSVEQECAVVLVAVRGLGEHDFVGASAHARPLASGDIVIALGDRVGIRDLARKAVAPA
mgnify:CR=1 FL=1